MASSRPIFDPDKMQVAAKTPTAPRTMTVSQLNALVKRILGDHLPGTIHLIGEISNLSRPASGHLYLTLKDNRGEIRCAMWRSAVSSLKFKPADGLEVIATGHVELYEPRGQYQFQIRKLEPRGTGALELAFRQLRDRLTKEGLFDTNRKKKIPRYPRHIAVVTSATGAAVSDIFKTLKRRYPCVTVSLYPVRVQGEGAAGEIAEAIGRLNRGAKALGGIDVMIVGRGGGSLEDLWAFNEEHVARAIAASKIPVISAVGHEVDVTIADLVADLRAPTPTGAAELAVPVLSEVFETLSQHETRIRRSIRHRLDLSRSRLEVVAQTPWLRDPMTLVRHAGQRIDETLSRLQLSISRRLAAERGRLHDLEIRLSAIHPRAVIHHRHQQLSRIRLRLHTCGSKMMSVANRRLHKVEVALAEASPQQRIRHNQAHIAQLARQLDRSAAHRLQLMESSLTSLETRLKSSSYQQTLARGFTITRTRKDRRMITAADQVAPGQEITTETAQGEFTSYVCNDDPNCNRQEAES